MATQPTPATAFDIELKVIWDNEGNLVIQSKTDPWKDQVAKFTNATGEHDAVLTLTFVDDSPFTSHRAGAIVKQDEVRPLVKNGKFFCGCTLTYHNGKQKGWKPADGTNSKQGAVVVIKP